jgi:hypothetical protein
MENFDRSILIDADVVSHFVTGGGAGILKQVFPKNPIYILDKVHAELQQWPSPVMLSELSRLLSKKVIKLMDFPDDNPEIVREYAWIKTMLYKGEGESACLAVARYNRNILASSNLKDTRNYCSMHAIDYLTTMDFLCIALQNNILTETRCDSFIQQVKASGGKLPVNCMQEHICRAIDFLGY